MNIHYFKKNKGLIFNLTHFFKSWMNFLFRSLFYSLKKNQSQTLNDFASSHFVYNKLLRLKIRSQHNSFLFKKEK